MCKSFLPLQLLNFPLGLKGLSRKQGSNYWLKWVLEIIPFFSPLSLQGDLTQKWNVSFCSVHQLGKVFTFLNGWQKYQEQYDISQHMKNMWNSHFSSHKESFIGTATPDVSVLPVAAFVTKAGTSRNWITARKGENECYLALHSRFAAPAFSHSPPTFWYPYHLRNHVLSLLLSICADYCVSLEIGSQKGYLHKNGFYPPFF